MFTEGSVAASLVDSCEFRVDGGGVHRHLRGCCPGFWFSVQRSLYRVKLGELCMDGAQVAHLY